VSKIETGRYSERLRRALGMKGQEHVAGELSPEVSPVIIIEGNDAEWQFLQGVRLCVSSLIQGAVAAENSIVRYLNPAGSRIIARFDFVGISTNAGSNLLAGYGQTQANLATVGATGLRDHRWVSGGTNDTAVVASRGNNVSLNFNSGLFNYEVIPSVFTVYSQPFIVLPGESLELGTSTTNIDLEVSVTWTERQLPSLEQ